MRGQEKVKIYLILLFIAVLLSSCGNQDKDREEESITEITFTFADGDEGLKAAMNEVIRKFNLAYPDIILRLKPGIQGSYSEFLKIKDSEGELPDVMEMRDTAMYVRAGRLAPLPEDVVSLFEQTVKIDGQVYTAPYSGENTLGIFYNKAYFDVNGWKEPDTYGEFLELCRAVRDKGEMAPLAVGGQDIWHMGFLFALAYNNRVLSTDPDFIKHCYEKVKDFSDPSFRQAMADLKELSGYMQEGWQETPDAQVASLLAEGKAAMVYTGIHLINPFSGSYQEFKPGWFPVKSQDGKLRIIGGISSSGLAISAAAAADPEKKEATETFLRFFFEKKNYQEFCESICTIPTTADPPKVPLHPVFEEIMEAGRIADEKLLSWNNMEGENELPADFRDFAYKTLIDFLLERIDLDDFCRQLNQQWNISCEQD